MIEQEQFDADCNKKCCLNCVFFERRNGFCRFNPPVPMTINVAGCQVTTAIFPRINMPNIDWCGKFQKRPDANENPA